MQYKGYAAKIEYDEEAKILHGQVLGIRDVVTFQADKAARIEKAFHDSVDDYLAFCKKRGEDPDKPVSGQFVVRIDQNLHRRLVSIAQAAGKSLNTVVWESLQREAENALAGDGGKSCPPPEAKKKPFRRGLHLKSGRRAAASARALPM
jgi:predicted HicB family RNase H-like nuclease